VAGFYKGLKLAQVGDEVVVEYKGHLDLDYVKKLIGVHRGPFEEKIDKLEEEVREIAEALALEYPGVRIPIDQEDFVFIFISVVLSRRADYERFVLRWCMRIWKLVQENPFKLLAYDEEELRHNIGTSYQIVHAKEALNDLRKLLLDLGVSSDDVYRIGPALAEVGLAELRRLLISKCSWIGPKVADSIILTSYGDVYTPPCDVHLITVSRRLGVVPEDARPPNVTYCAKYICSKCPITDHCVRSLIVRRFKDLAAWYQTLAYLHARKYCRTYKPLCQRCPLRAVCEKNNLKSETADQVLRGRA